MMILLPFLSFAQGKIAAIDTTISTLDEVVITATRTIRQLSSLPLPVQIISKSQIRKTGAMRLNEVLEEQTGLIIVPDFGGVLGVQMQGLDAQYTLILIDGVPLVGRSAGTLDLSRITINNIKQIEIVKGASSSLYGSEALGGVINIITETPTSTKFKGELNGRFGSFLTLDNSLNLNFGFKNLKVNAAFNSFATQGYDLIKNDLEKTVLPFSNTTSQIQLNYKFNDKLKMLISNRYFRQINDVESFINLNKAAGSTKTHEFNSHSRLFYDPSKALNYTLEFYATRYLINNDIRFESTNQLFNQDFFNENLLRPEFRTSYNLRNATYSSGFGYNVNNLERTFFANKANNDSYYGFLQYDYNVKDKINILAGIRYDKNLAYASVISPKLALNYYLNKYFSLQSSVGYGFKAPDLRQLFFNFENVGVGYIVLGYNVAAAALDKLESENRIQNTIVPANFFNNQLLPENSIGYNLGLKYNYKKVNLSTNLFYNKVQNLIDTRAVARLNNGQNIFSYANIGSVFTRGIECNATYKIVQNVEISAGYQFLDAKDNDVIAAINNNKIFARDEISSQSFQLKTSDYFGLFNRSKHTANFKYFVKIPSWNISHNFRAVYRSKYGLFDTNDNAILDNFDEFANEYVILDASVTKKIAQFFELQLGVDNILNFTDPQNAVNFAGRLLYCRVQYNF